MSDIEKKNSQMKFDTENLAMPEIHVSHKKNESAEEVVEKVCAAEKKIQEELSAVAENLEETEDKDEIDFSGAIPEIHFHKKTNK